MPPKRIDRPTRVALFRELRGRGLTSREIGERYDLAPSTVRDYLRDPELAIQRRRQRALGVSGVTQPAGGTPIRSVKPNWRRGGPHRGKSEADAVVRGDQMRAVIGSYARRGFVR